VVQTVLVTPYKLLTLVDQAVAAVLMVLALLMVVLEHLDKVMQVAETLVAILRHIQLVVVVEQGQQDNQHQQLRLQVMVEQVQILIQHGLQQLQLALAVITQAAVVVESMVVELAAQAAQAVVVTVLELQES
jgi:hypothetical protein